MKIKTTQEVLLQAFIETSKIIPTRTTLPVLSCVLIKAKKEKTTITATDLEQTLVIEIKAKTEKEGTVAVPNHRLLELVSALPPGELELSENSDLEIELNTSRGAYKIIGKEPDEYPEISTPKKDQTLSFTGKELLEIINSTTYAASKDDLKPALCGVYLNIKNKDLIAVATDGHRLVKYKKELQNNNPDGSIIVPIKFFNFIKNQITEKQKIEINISNNHIEVEEKKKKLTSRIIKENFPDFNSVIPDDLKTKATINTKNLLNGVKRVAIFSNKTTKQILLNFNHNELLITTEDQETRASAKERMECNYKDEPQTIAYNAQYLKEVVQHMQEDETEVFLSGALTAAIFRPKKQKEKTQITTLLMPLRINK